MRGGHHEVARTYVLYRERRAQGTRQVPKAVPAEPALHVTDNGQRVPLDFGKLQALVESACAGLGADVRRAPVLAETSAICTTACRSAKCTRRRSWPRAR